MGLGRGCMGTRLPDRAIMERGRTRRRVVVVGAGVIGLSTAVHLSERFGDSLEVTLVAEKFSPNTTADQAGTLLMPIDWNADIVASTSQKEKNKRIQRWAETTIQRFHLIYSSEANADVQLVLRPGYIFRYSSPPTEPAWKDLMFGFRHVDVKSEEARAINAPPDCTDIWAFLTYLLNCSKYLEWLLSVFISHGGLVERRRIACLDELHSYDIIINCTGLGSRELIGDTSVQPAKGELLLVDAPWASHFVLNVREDSDGIIYILPRVDGVALGGSVEKGNFSTSVEPASEKRILHGCKKLIPSLSRAKVMDKWAGLRPLGESIRLEGRVNKKGGVVIHCYGHGGSGIVLSWGCAIDIGDIVAHSLTSVQAKL